MKLIEDYLMEIERNMPDSKARNIVRRKVEKHLYRRVGTLMEQKYDEKSAAMQAIDELGDAQTIGPKLKKTCMPKWYTIPITAALIGFIILFFIFNGFNILSYINLIDWEGHDLKYDWISTILFSGISVFLFIALKTKNRLVFWLTGIFISGYFLITFFTGLFQPLWYSWAVIITHGWHYYLNSLFSYGELSAGTGILVGLLGFLTDIFLAVFCFTAAIRIGHEQIWIVKPHWRKRFLLFSYSLLIISAVSLIIIASGTGIAKKAHMSEMSAQSQSEMEGYKKALKLFYSTNADAIKAFDKDYNDIAYDGSLVQFSVLDSGEIWKRALIYNCHGVTHEMIQKVDGIQNLESFKKVLLPEYTDEIECTYNKNGKIEECYSYHTENMFSKEYYVFTFVNGVMTDRNYSKSGDIDEFFEFA